MKNIFSKVMLVAAAATAFFSCQKPEVIEPATSEEVMLTFSSEKPAFDDETKTEWTGETKTIQWSKGDKISVAYTVAGSWQNASGDASGDAKLYKSEELTAASETAKFNVSTYFTGATSGSHVFYGVYPAPSSTDFPESPVATLTVAPSQTPKADSFDSNGDLMIGVSNEYGSRPSKDETISLKWERLVAHAVISLKNINGLTADEKIENITLTAQDAANLVGRQKVNLITKEVVKDNATANILKLSASNLTVSEGILSFWACVLPETITSLTVVVETDKATYTREITGISKTFKQNARNTLAVKMNDAVRVEKVVASDEVVDVLNRALTGITGTNYASWTGKTSVSGAVYAGQSAGGNDAIQLRSNNSNSGIVTTTSGGFAKKVALTWESNTANGRTLNVYGSNSAYSAPTDLYEDAKAGTKLGTIVCGTSTELVIDGDYEYIGLRSNSSAMYISEIKITWSTGSATPDTTPSVELDIEDLELTADESKGTIGVDAKNIASIVVRALVEEGSQEESDWLVAEYDEANSCVTYSALANESEESRKAFIEVYCLDAEDNVIIAGINVTQKGFATEPAGPQTITVADFLELKDTETEYILTGKITRVANTTYGNFDITDATGTVYVYGLLTPDGTAQKQWGAAGLKQGDIITVNGTYNEYNGDPQIKNAVYVSHKAINVDNSDIAFAAEGGSFDVTATLVNATEAISVSVDNSHFTVALKSGTTYTVTAPANETDENIYANLTFTAGDLTAVVTISQEAPVVEGEVAGGRDDFNTVNANSGYAARTTTAGWKGTNCAVLQGGTSDSNPTFMFIGSTNATRAFTINGKTSAKGTITSPTLTTGCGKLSLKYGIAFSESNGVDFTVSIKQNGAVVKTFKVDVNSVTQKKAYTWEQDVNVAGDFVIEITNNCPSNSTSNKDRVSIWDVEWTGYKN